MMVEDEEFVEGGGIFLGERVRPHRSSGENVRSLPVSSELLNMLIHVRPGRLWRGKFFPGRELVRKGGEKFGKGSSSVTSELVTMLSHFSPVRW